LLGLATSSVCDNGLTEWAGALTISVGLDSEASVGVEVLVVEWLITSTAKGDLVLSWWASALTLPVEVLSSKAV